MGTGATVATLTDASELPGTVTVAQVNYSTVTDGEVREIKHTQVRSEVKFILTHAGQVICTVIIKSLNINFLH